MWYNYTSLIGRDYGQCPPRRIRTRKLFQVSLEALSSFTDISERNELSAIRVLDIMRSAESDMLETTIQTGSPRDLFKSWRTITRAAMNS